MNKQIHAIQLVPVSPQREEELVPVGQVKRTVVNVEMSAVSYITHGR